MKRIKKEPIRKNIISHGRKDSGAKKFCLAFVNPFSAILLVLAAISAFTDIILAKPAEKNYVTVLIILIMITLSGILRFLQETRSGNVTEKLMNMIHTTACVERDGIRREIPMEEIVVGDIVYLSAGDMVPADVRILSSKDLFVSQSALTGESEPVEKSSSCLDKDAAPAERNNLAFMGSNVVSGSASAQVTAIGNDTLLGSMAGELGQKAEKSAFEKGIHSVSWLLIRFMFAMVPIVLFINGITKNDWLQATLFAVSIAVGLTPEMLPMIVTAVLAKGAVAMSREKVIIKNMNSIQNLGAMDILCTDKTGTLTQDKVVLEYHLNIDGEEDERVLRHAFLNSFFQTGLKNLIDIAVIEKQTALSGSGLAGQYTKTDEIPFDFQRRRMSVVVQDRTGKSQMITKGAVEEMLDCCSYAEYKGKVCPLSNEMRKIVLSKAGQLNAQGMRVIAVAQKTNPSPAGVFSVEDEKNMVLIGFLAFLDPPKSTAKAAVRTLRNCGVAVKILTGDNEKVACAVCRQVGLEWNKVMSGSEIDFLDDSELSKQAENVTIFAKLSPSQKSRIIRVLREQGHTVGYMGDGINDAAAMEAADVGISVDTAVDIAKECASVVLSEKDLTVLEKGVAEGRKTYANMMKYIKITVSSNFGNIFSILAAGAFLPFMPLASIQLILLNLIYDITCTAIPWDAVDDDYLKYPRRWSSCGIKRFMLWFGPASSVFDIVTYLLMYFLICPSFTEGLRFTQLADPMMKATYIAVFQAGWFIESMWSQSLAVQMLRTSGRPFIRNMASLPVILCTGAGITAVTVFPFLPIGSSLGLAPLPGVYFLWLFAVLLGYILLISIIKKEYIRKYREFL